MIKTEDSTTNNHTEITEDDNAKGRVEALLPKIQAMSWGYANGTIDEDTEDAFQEAVLAILQKGEESPDFYNQTESYIIHCGRLRLWYCLREKRVFDRYQYYILDDENGHNVLDTVYSDETSPEDALILKQELEAVIKALESLSGQEKTVLGMVVAGVKTKDIASQLGISEAAVSNYKARAREKIRSYE